MKRKHRNDGHLGRAGGAARTAAAYVLLAAASWARAGTLGDVEPNGVVDLRDLLRIRNAVGQAGAPGFIPEDLSNDGLVGGADILIWRANFPQVGTVLAPYLAIFTPADGSLIGDRRPTIVVDYSPTSLNVNPATFHMVVDGVDRSADAITSYRSAVLSLEDRLSDGPHFVEASIQDTQGTTASARSDYTVTALTLQPTASPVSGPAPLEVSFRPDVIWSEVPPAFYRWDYDNNGVFEIDDPRPDLRVNTFFEEGLHTVRFQVQLSNGTVQTTTLQIAVTESFASVSPSNGTAPLTVFLHGIAADLADPIVKYEWDFDYNGVFGADFTSTVSPNTAHIYPTAGVYRPRFRATHQSNAVIEHPIVQQELQVTGGGTPTAIASAAQGPNALTVNFAGAGSDDGAIVLYEWDFENDGVFDFSSPTTGVTSHAYPTAGAKIAAFRVRDNDGRTSMDRVRIDTFAPAALEVLDDTVIPSADEEVPIRTTTTIESTVWLYVRDSVGRILRTLVDHEVRPAGTYDDFWDGRDFRFEPAHPGAYYVVLQYSYPGRTDTLDLTDTTGDAHYFANKPPPVVASLDPLSNEPLPMVFDIPSASRASLYVLPGGTNRTNTVFDNLALGAGRYTYYWSGVDSEGTFAPASTYLWTVNGWTLAENAVVVRGQPAIENVVVTPTQLSPTDRPLGSAISDVAFDLVEPSSVFVKIINMDNQNTLRSIVLPDLGSGANGFLWDGKTETGEYASPGFYRVLMTAVDEYGNLSIERDAVMEIRY